MHVRTNDAPSLRQWDLLTQTFEKLRRGFRHLMEVVSAIYQYLLALTVLQRVGRPL